MPLQILLSVGCIFDSLLRFSLLCLRLCKKTAANSQAADARLAGKCCILIPAHNEAGTIGATVAAIQTQLAEWPGARMWVLADRCTDATAAEAAQAGAEVAIRTAGAIGKGAVLAWWLQTHSCAWAAQDCVVILDADSRLAAGSLQALRGAMQSDAVAAQAFVAPAATNNAGRLAGWSEVLMQRIDDEARLRCGWNVPLRGTGMVFRTTVLAELAPRLHTLAEDLELDVLLAARQSKVLFVPQAVVFDPKPQQTAGASRQRARWLQGQWQVIRDYWPVALRALLKGGAGVWFLLWLLFLRPKTALMGLRAFLLLAGLLLGQAGLWLSGIALLGLLMDVLYYLGGALLIEERARYLQDLLAAPRYVAMWLCSLGLATIRRGWLKAGR
ncbi:MAG: glycosyltransferase [Acidobacteria bacterium]|nr:glycosyltransferase [Acidobacteriota bacterium]MBI3427057.1 glycosyltransferase [Acidobacteriota bacterium]